MENAKMPRLLAFARHVEMVIIEALKPRSVILMGSRALFITTGTRGFGDGTRLAMPKTIYMPDSSSLKPGSGATQGVLD